MSDISTKLEALHLMVQEIYEQHEVRITNLRPHWLRFYPMGSGGPQFRLERVEFESETVLKGKATTHGNVEGKN